MRKKTTTNLDLPSTPSNKGTSAISPRSMPLVSPRSISSSSSTSSAVPNPVPLTAEEKRRRELEAEKKLQSALQSTMRGAANVPVFKPDPSKSAEENAKAKREFEGEQKLQLALTQLHVQKEAIQKQEELRKVDVLGQRAAELQQRRLNRRTNAPAASNSSTMSATSSVAWPSAGPVLTAPAAATERPVSSANASGRLENSVVSLLNMQIERLTAELQKKGEELIAERERADQAVAAASSSPVSSQADKEELERLRQELREERQRAEDAMGSIDRLRSATTSQSSASQLAEVEITGLREQLRNKNRELEVLSKELSLVRSDFQEVEAVAVQHLVDKDKLTLENKSMAETIARQTAKIDSLTSERSKQNDNTQQLTAELDQACRYTDAETNRADAATARVKELEAERERFESALQLKATEIASLSQMISDQKQRLELLMKQSDNTSEQTSQMRREAEETKSALKNAQVEIENLRKAELAIQARATVDKELKEKEVAIMREKYEKDIERLKKTVDGMASGRGRLNELSSLQAELEKKEEEWEQEKQELEDQIKGLTAEVETLAESNQQLIAALEGDGDKAEKLGSKLESKAFEDRVASLESELSVSAAEVLRLRESLSKTEAELQERNERVLTLEERLAAATKETSLLGGVLKSTQASAERLQKEVDQKTQSSSAQIASLTSKANDLEVKLNEVQSAKTSLEAELNKLKNADQEEREEIKAEMMSLRERLNEAIQERWLVSEKLAKIQKEAEREATKASGAPNMAEVDAKQREMTRRIQDLEGEVKRSKIELQKANEKIGAMIIKQKERDDETAKLNKAFKDMSNQIVELEHDLQISEKTCDEYEELVNQLKAEIENKQQ